MRMLFRILLAVIITYVLYGIGYLLDIEPRLFMFLLTPFYFGGLYLYQKFKKTAEERTVEEEKYLKMSLWMAIYISVFIVAVWLWLKIDDFVFALWVNGFFI